MSLGEANLVPRLATEWFVKKGDPNTWVFRLRDGVTFSDGAELTAEDVVFSLDRARSEHSLLRQLRVDVRDVRAILGYRLDEAPLRSSDVADVNPLHDRRVREAFELAIDRDAIREVILRGNGIPTGILLPPLVHGWTEELDAYPAQDLDRARALLAEAGYPNGFSITLDAPNNRYVNDEAIAQAVVGFLSQIGAEATLVSRPFAQHSPLLVNAESDFYLFGWGVPTFDSAYNLNDLIHSRTGNYDAWNATGYLNPEIDAKIQSIASETDVETRGRTIDELWHFVKDEHLYLRLHNQVTAWALRSGIAIDPDPSNSPNIRSVTFASQ